MAQRDEAREALVGMAAKLNATAGALMALRARFDSAAEELEAARRGIITSAGRTAAMGRLGCPGAILLGG